MFARRISWRALVWAVVVACALGAPAIANADTRHVVRRGETLTAIAAQYGVDLHELAARNGISNIHHIIEGQSLLVANVPAVHRVAPNENLTLVARRYGVSVADLAAANGISNPNLVFVGQLLQLPGGIGGAAPPTGPMVQHRVAPGESLGLLAMRYGVSVSALAAANDISNVHLVYVGQVLRIPGTSAPVFDFAYVERALTEAEREFGLPNGLMRALAMQESGWQQHVVSTAGAIGVAQLLPETAEWLMRDFLPDAVNWRHDPRDNARLAALQMWLHLRNYGGDLNSALAAYYQGAGNLARFGFFPETWQYISNVRALMGRYE